jgi:hypothetical protein
VAGHGRRVVGHGGGVVGHNGGSGISGTRVVSPWENGWALQIGGRTEYHSGIKEFVSGFETL